MADSLQLLPTFTAERSVAQALLEGTQTIVARAAPLIPSDRIVIRKLDALGDSIQTPCAVVSFIDETSDDANSSNSREGVAYRVLVSMVRASGQTVAADARYWEEMAIRQSLRRAMIGVRSRHFDLPANCCHIVTTMESGKPLVPEKWRKQLDAQYIQFRIVVREPRDTDL